MRMVTLVWCACPCMNLIQQHEHLLEVPWLCMACLRFYTCLQGAAPWTNTSCMVLYAAIMFGMPTHHCTDSCTSTKLLCVCGSCSRVCCALLMSTTLGLLSALSRLPQRRTCPGTESSRQHWVVHWRTVSSRSARCASLERFLTA